MELVDGRSLALVIHEGAVSPPKAIARGRWQICDALAAAHACGIVHRATSSPGQRAARTSAAASSSQTSGSPAPSTRCPTGSRRASPAPSTTSPRSSSAPSPRRTHDRTIYALGVLLFELFTRELPFVGPHPMQRARSRDAPSLPWIRSGDRTHDRRPACTPPSSCGACARTSTSASSGSGTSLRHSRPCRCGRWRHLRRAPSPRRRGRARRPWRVGDQSTLASGPAPLAPFRSGAQPSKTGRLTR